MLETTARTAIVVSEVEKMPKRRSSPRSRTENSTPSAPGTPDVMTIQELAAYLKLAVETLYKKVQAHEIPFTKVGSLLRFTKSSIDQWLAPPTTTAAKRIRRTG